MTISKPDSDAAPPASATSTDAPFFGMAMAVVAFFMVTCMTMFAKLLSDTHHVIEIGFWRNVVALLPFAVILALPSKRNIWRIKSKPRVIAIRAFVGTVNLVLVFAAFSLLPMANATSLIFTSALFIPVLGVIFLGESVGPYRASAVAVGFIGVLIVAQPGGDGSWSLLGVAFGLAGALLAATLGILLRLLGQTEAPETVTFYFLLLGTLFIMPAMAFDAQWPALEDVPYIIGLGLSGFFMQMSLTFAFKYAPASIVAPFNYTQLIWAVLFGWLIFSEVPTPNIMIGAAIIVASSLIVILRERYLARQGRLKRQAAAETTQSKAL